MVLDAGQVDNLSVSSLPAKWYPSGEGGAALSTEQQVAAAAGNSREAV